MFTVRKSVLQSLLLAAAVTVLLSGCAAQRAVSHFGEATAAKAEQDFQASRRPETNNSAFQVDQGFFAATNPILVTPVNPSVTLPPPFFRPVNVAVRNSISLPEIAANVASGSGIRVVLMPDVTATPAGAAGAPAAPAASVKPEGLPPLPTSLGDLAGAGAPASATAPPAAPEALPVASNTGTAEGLKLDGFSYKGNVGGLLDALTSRLGLAWRWNGQEVQIFRYETRLFRISALAGDSSVQANLSTQAEGASGGSGSSGGGVSGSSGQNTTVNSKLAIWSDVEASIKANKSAGGSYSMNPSAGLVSVRDTPAVLDEIGAQMKEFNRVYSRQVILNIDIYSVEHSNGDDYGVDWSVFWKNAGRYGISLGNKGSTGSAGSPFGPSFTFTRTGGPFSGSNAVGAALSTLGHTDLVTSVQAVTLNGQTVPVNVSKEQAYLKSYSTTLNGSTAGQSTTTLTPGVVTEGFSMNFTPRIMDDGDVIMRYAVDLSNIDNITTFTSPDGNSAIQLPTRSVRNFLQNSELHSGQSLMVTGLQQVQGKDTSSGPFSGKAWFLGGRRTSTSLNRTVVIVVTPYVVQQ